MLLRWIVPSATAALLLVAACTDAPTESTEPRSVHIRLSFESWYTPTVRFGLTVDGAPLEDPAVPGTPWRWDGRGTASLPLPAGARTIELAFFPAACWNAAGNDVRHLPAGPAPILLEFRILCQGQLGPGHHLVWAEEDWAAPGGWLVAARADGTALSQQLPNFLLAELVRDGDGGLYALGGRLAADPDYGLYELSRDLLRIDAAGDAAFLTTRRWLAGLSELPGGRLGVRDDRTMRIVRPGLEAEFGPGFELPDLGLHTAGVWAPGGDRVAVSDGATIRIQSTTDSLPRPPILVAPAMRSAPAWSPAGDAIAIVIEPAGVEQLMVMSSAGGVVWRAPLGEVFSWGNPVWLPDGSGVVLAGIESAKPGLFLLTPDGAVRRLTLRSLAATAVAAWSDRARSDSAP